jgi:hypothetical protein
VCYASDNYLRARSVPANAQDSYDCALFGQVREQSDMPGCNRCTEDSEDYALLGALGNKTYQLCTSDGVYYRPSIRRCPMCANATLHACFTLRVPTLGQGAVHGAMAGYTGFTIGLVNNHTARVGLLVALSGVQVLQLERPRR